MQEHNALRTPWRPSLRSLARVTLLFCLLTCSLYTRAQVSAYTFAQTSGTFTAINGANVAGLPNGDTWDDDISNALAIPFTFTFNGVGYTSCFVSCNGFLTFGATAPGGTNYTPISSGGAYTGAIAAFGRDLINQGTAGATFRVRSEVLGSSPSRTFVVEWRQARRYNSGAVTGDNLTFQVRLSETTNVIQVVYGTMTITSTTALTCQVGLRGAANTDYNNRTTTTNWASTTAGGANNASCTSSNTVKPASGQTYTWTPPVVSCVAPTLSLGSVTPTSASASWTCSGCTGTYVLEYGPSGYTPGSGLTAGVGGTLVSATATSPTTISGLQPGTAYTVALRQNCGAGSFSTNSTITGSTTCGTYTVPWTSSFEGAVANNSQTMPDCHARAVVSGANADAWRTRIASLTSGGGGTMNARTGTDYMYMVYGTSSWLFTPGIQMTAGTSYDFKYYYALSDAIAGFTLTTAVGTAQTAAGMTTTLGTIGTVTNTAYLPAKYTFVAPSSGTYYFGVLCTDNTIDPWDIATDDWSVTLTPPCAPPSNVAVSNISDVGASLNWTANGALNYDYEVRTSGAAGSGNTGLAASGNVTAPPASVAGLTANTTYQVYVRGNCTGPIVGDWTDAVSFTTACAATTVPFSESFNGVTIPAFPSCWTIVDVNGPDTDFGTGYWETTSGVTGYTGNTAQYGYASAIPADDWMISPGIALTGGTSYRLKYKYSASDADYTEKMQVFYGTSAAPANLTTQLADHGSFNFTVPAQVVIDFTPASTGTYYFGWHAISDADQFNIYVDDVSVTVTPTCLDVTGLAVSNVLAHSMDVNWTCTGCTGQFIVEYGPQGYTPGTDGNAGAGGTLVSANATSPTHIAGLAAGTAYTVVVRQFCGGVDYSPNSTVDVITSPGCASSFYDPGGPSAEYVDNTNSVTTICPDNAGDAVTVTFSAFATEASYDPIYVFNGTSVSAPKIASANAAPLAGNVYGAGGYWGTTIPGPFTSTDASGCLTFAFTSDGSGTAAGWTAAVTCAPLPVPACVATPTAPANAAVLCTAPTLLSWPAAAYAMGYDVYFDPGAGPATTLVSSNQPGTTYALGTITAATYSWRVVPRNTSGPASGCSDWTFTLTPEPPGARAATAITIASLPASISGNNRTANCYANNFTTTSTPGNANARPGPDVFYKITTDPCTSTLSARVCASTGGNPWVHLITTLGVNVAFNNNESPAVCANTLSAAVTNVPVLPNTTYYIVVDGNGAGGAGEFDYTLDVTQTFTGGDTDGDGTPDCSDGCPNDPNKVEPGICGCGFPDDDADNDGLADCFDQCPNAPEPGQACNDHDPATVDDTQDESCTCVGTPLPTTAWNLQITTDANGSETSWDITEVSTGDVLASGSGLPSNSTVDQVVNVPTTGTWYLNVHDSGNNGITGGGYLLKDADGKRVIDNTANFITGGLSQAPEGFNSVVGADRLRDIDCDNVERRVNEMIVAVTNPLVTAQWQVGNQTDDGYEFWFFDPNGTYSRHIFRNHATSGGYAPADATRACKLGLASWSVNPLPQNKLLDVRVRGRVNGVNLDFGPACRLKVDPVAANCHTTQLEYLTGPYFSCGVTGLKTNGSSRIWAKPVTRYIQATNTYLNANKYKFHFVNVGEATSFDIVINSYPMLIYPQYGFHLGATYDVTVQASFDNGASYCPVGATCQISFAATNNRIDADPAEGTTSNDLLLWPNPNRGDQLYLSMAGFDKQVDQVTVDILDMFGKRVMGRTITLNDGSLNTMLQLDDQLASGLYLVNLTAGDRTITKRLVIQR